MFRVESLGFRVLCANGQKPTANDSFCQFDYFEVTECSAIDGEAYEGAHLVETVDACGTGIDVQCVDVTVVHHLEDM